MAESRIEKYKEYRNSILSESTPNLTAPKYTKGNKEDSNNDSIQTTSTLPMDEVMQALVGENDEVVYLRKHHRKKVIFISVMSFLALCLVVAIVVVGILLWR